MTRLTAHLVRGATGAVLIGWALFFAATQPAIAVAPMDLVALRGRPACWMLGLWDTLTRR
jgi:hypothetical protein